MNATEKEMDQNPPKPIASTTNDPWWLAQRMAVAMTGSETPDDETIRSIAETLEASLLSGELECTN